MSGKYLLDTNIVIALFASDANVQIKLSQAGEVSIASIVFGELYYGARNSGRVEANVQRVDELAASGVIINCDVETAQHYAIIKSNLKSKGKPIPENDIWIAALALQYNLTLVTRDNHFHTVDNLVIETW
jgi:tRNA(fMet)-specific endonuclease VapC